MSSLVFSARDVNWENKYNFHILLVHLIQLDLLILFILMYEVKHLFPPRVVMRIMLFLLMITLGILGFTL